MLCYLYQTEKLRFTYRLLVIDTDSLHVIYILFFDLLLALYYSIDIAL